MTLSFSSKAGMARSLFSTIFLLTALSAVPALAAPAGTLVDTAGTVFVLKQDGKKKIVAPGSIIEQGDSIQTESDSTAKIRYSDGSQMVIRPNTVLAIQNYHFDETKPEKDSFVMGLVRGGLRQITGFIGKRGNQEAYQLRGSTSTIGIRGTDFTARVCEGSECKASKEGSKVPAQNIEGLAGKLVEVRGKVSAIPTSGVRRDLAVGSAIYQNDLIEAAAGSHAAILFTDETRVVLTEDSSFRVGNYRYVKAQPENGQIFFNIVKGAFRMVTGLVGKAAQKNVLIGTSTATIGIRGTSFDLACVPAGISNPESYSGSGALCGTGLLTSTRDGAISITTDDGKISVFAAGQSSYLSGANQTPIVLNRTPEFLNQLPGPVPDKIQIDMSGTFGVDGSSLSEAGLFVTVSEGRVIIAQAGRDMLLNAGESGFASGTSNQLQRLNVPPPFLREDEKRSQESLGFRSCRM